MSKGNGVIRETVSWLGSFTIAILAALFIVSNIVSITMVMEQSMEPTFSQGDRLIVNRAGCFFGSPRRGEVIIFDKNPIERGIFANMVNELNDIRNNLRFRLTGKSEKNLLIKRVIAVEGDLVELIDGKVYINGDNIEEPYIKTMTFSRGENLWRVPEGKMFVLGDNRENSLDSRLLGFIDKEQVKGKVALRFFPFSKFGVI